MDDFALTNPIIGIHGLAGSGKTTLATAIAVRLENACIIPFAGPVKQVARDMGWDGKKDAKGRRLLQLLGTDCGRECIDQDIWVRRWEKEALAHIKDGDVVIADDVRFWNETVCVRAQGGICIKIVRPGCGRRFRLLSHKSERSLPDKLFHMIFDNDGALEDLEWYADYVASLLGKRFQCSLV